MKRDDVYILNGGAGQIRIPQQLKSTFMPRVRG
jgi:hypothetical protein